MWQICNLLEITSKLLVFMSKKKETLVKDFQTCFPLSLEVINSTDFFEMAKITKKIIQLTLIKALWVNHWWGQTYSLHVIKVKVNYTIINVTWILNEMFYVLIFIFRSYKVQRHTRMKWLLENTSLGNSWKTSCWRLSECGTGIVPDGTVG